MEEPPMTDDSFLLRIHESIFLGRATFQILKYLDD